MSGEETPSWLVEAGELTKGDDLSWLEKESGGEGAGGGEEAVLADLRRAFSPELYTLGVPQEFVFPVEDPRAEALVRSVNFSTSGFVMAQLPPGEHYAVISDIHANDAALEAVIEDIDRWATSVGGISGILCPGDIIGYNHRPLEVLEKLERLAQRYPLFITEGNHDRGIRDKPFFDDGSVIKETVEIHDWTRTQLEEAGKLSSVEYPSGFILEWKGKSGKVHPIILTHADVVHLGTHGPVAYIGREHGHLPPDTQYHAMGDSHLLIGGHTHFFLGDPNALARKVVNPGSVGQPRDGNQRASWAKLTLRETPERKLYMGFTEERVPYGHRNFALSLEGANGFPQKILIAKRIMTGR